MVDGLRPAVRPRRVGPEPGGLRERASCGRAGPRLQEPPSGRRLPRGGMLGEIIKLGVSVAGVTEPGAEKGHVFAK